MGPDCCPAPQAPGCQCSGMLSTTYLGNSAREQFVPLHAGWRGLRLHTELRGSDSPPAAHGAAPRAGTAAGPRTAIDTCPGLAAVRGGAFRCPAPPNTQRPELQNGRCSTRALPAPEIGKVARARSSHVLKGAGPVHHVTEGTRSSRPSTEGKMAAEREPPPLGEARQPELEELEDGEDLFTSTVSTLESSPSSPEPASLPTEDISTNSNGPKPAEIILDDDREDLFAEATEEVSLDSPEREPILSPDPTPAITPVTPTTLVTPRMESKSITAPVIFDRSREEIEEEANGDVFDIEINVSDPEKVGDGMNAYMAYRVTTKTSLSMFHKNEFSVKRRFSDFLGLHSKLATKYLHIGYIVPPAPEKSIVGMTKVKVGKEDSSSTEFVEKRRAALERYLQRTVKHPTLLQDPDLRQFLESSELPRAVNTQALSGAGILRMVNKAADAVNKMTIKMNESDAWFEEKQQQFENLDQQLRKLHASVEALVCHRKELSANTAAFAKSAAMLGNSEDHTALSRALSQLAEVEEKIDQLHQEQAFADFYVFSELLGDYIRLIAAVKGVLDHRMKCWQKWQDAQVTLQKKREAEAKLQLANKPDKLQQAKDEIKEWETKVQQGERDFEQISKTIRKEVGRFEKERVKDFKTVIIKYLESLVQTQQQLIKYWEAFLPEAKAIA
uniref:Sorting nexin-2 n=2 Tax=Terrapene triunguis TaxID=2587831 RepID=A0A674K6Q5_9SAUR